MAEPIYCVKCKAKTATNNVSVVSTKNNRKAQTGTCAKCGTKKYKFIKG